MQKKLVVGIVVVALVLIGLFSGAFTQKADTKEPVKIGIALPLTGGAAFLGESEREAALLALKDIGPTKYNYSLIFEDDAFTPAKTATVASKFVNVDKVLAMITFGSGTSNAAAPITENAKVVRFGLASDPTSLQGEYNYIHWTPAFKEGELLAQEIVKRGYKTVAIVNANHPGTNAVAEAIKKSLENSPVKLVAYENTNIGDKDFRTVATKLKGLNPDIEVLTMFSPEMELFTKQSREMGVTSQFTAAETFEWSNEPKLYEGMWFVSDASVPQAFIDKFTKEYNHNPKAGSTYVYDLVTLIVKYQESSNKKLSSTDLKNLVNQNNGYESPLFGKVSIDKDGLFITDASLKIMKDGQAEVVK